jgi:hypothetical protein
MQALPVSRVELSALRLQHPRDFHEKYRTDHRRLLVVTLGGTGFSSVVICSARDEYLASLGFGVFPDCSGDLLTLAAALGNDDEFGRKFAVALKDAGIEPQRFPVGLCSPLDQMSRIGNNFPRGVGKKFDAFAWAYRISSAIVPNAAVETAIDFVKRQSEQFEALAAIPAPEEVDGVIWHPDFSEIPSRSAIVFESDDFETFAALGQLSTEQKTNVLGRLEELLELSQDRLESAIRLFPLHHVRLAPQLYLPPTSSAADERIVLCRARLIRRLGWPWHYQAVTSWLTKYQNYRIPRPPNHEKVLLECSQEIAEFLRSVEVRFPIVLSRPFERSIAVPPGSSD